MRWTEHEIMMVLRPCCNVIYSICVQDFAYHGLAAFFYLSAGVDLAYITFLMKLQQDFRLYQIDIAAVVRDHSCVLHAVTFWSFFKFESIPL